jgi:hypothetical protein
MALWWKPRSRDFQRGDDTQVGANLGLAIVTLLRLFFSNMKRQCSLQPVACMSTSRAYGQPNFNEDKINRLTLSMGALDFPFCVFASPVC